MYQIDPFSFSRDPETDVRREFAKFALVGLISRGDMRNPDALAASAFEIADAMLAREHGEHS